MKKLLLYIFITLFIGGIPSISVITNNVYPSLVKPPLSPPGILFPIVWTILFILMGISIYLVRDNKDLRKIYFIQLFINALWTPIFFGLNNYLFALIWLILLLVTVIIMLYKFYKENKTSCYLNIPYLIWLLFALYLNTGIYLLNK
jgi:tryptophan-rich sensory protein